MGMMMILVSWVVLSTLGCLSLALVAARAIPSREQNEQFQSDESEAPVFAGSQPAIQPGLVRALATNR